MTLTMTRSRAGLLAGYVAVAFTCMGCPPAEPPRIPPSGFPVSVNVPIDEKLVESARQTLLTLAKAPEATARAHAIEGLRDASAPEAAGVIEKGLDDPNQIVRFAAAFAAGELKLDGLRGKLLELVSDPDPRVRIGVRFALHRLGDTSRSGDFEKYAQTFTYTPPQPIRGIDEQQIATMIRGTTAFVLGRLGEPSAVNVLRLLRLDDNPVVRIQAEESLFLLGDARAEKVVGGLTLSRFPDDQMLGLHALGERGEIRFRNYARNQLNYDYPEVALAAAIALGGMDADDGFGVALKEINAQPERADEKEKEKAIIRAAHRRQMAASAMGWIGRPDAQSALAIALKDPEPDVRAAAASAILRIAKQPKIYARNGDLLK